MEHHFNVEIAKIYGVNEAIIIHNIMYWLQKNIANKTNLYDGYYWTYNSIKAFRELFPYFSDNQIRHILKKLIEKNVIKTGSYNKAAFDKTKWYTIINKKIYEIYKFPKSIWENSQMEVGKFTNGSGKIHKPIPNSKPNSKPNNKLNNDEFFNSSDFTSIIKTEKKEKRKKVAQKKENPHYKEFIDIFFEFYQQRAGVEYKFTAIDGKAIKKIIKYIVKIDKNNNPGAAWQFILDSYPKWDKFYQKQLKINQIDSNLPNIINQIRNTESAIDYELELQKAYT